jgi:hypothetical protein
VIELFALLLFAHFLFDYPLQGDWLARAKNRSDPIPHVPWYQAMFAHTAMHGMAVWIITGIPLLGLAEMAIHWITDDLKLQGELTFNQDQAIHIVCKAVWAVITVLVMVI